MKCFKIMKNFKENYKNLYGYQKKYVNKELYKLLGLKEFDKMYEDGRNDCLAKIESFLSVKK